MHHGTPLCPYLQVSVIRQGLTPVQIARTVLPMTSGHPEWRVRADRLGVRMPVIAKATGANVHTVRAYSERRFNPTAEWVARVHRFLDEIEFGTGGAVA